MSDQKFPPGWDEKRVRQVLDHYEGQSEDEQADASFRAQWEAWDPDVPLVTLHTMHRALGPPIVEYLRAREQEDPHRRVVVVIPEVQPDEDTLSGVPL